MAHDGAATVGAFLSRRRFYGTSAGPLALRHGDAMAPLQASGWSVTVWLLGLLRRPGLAMVAQATSIVLLAHRLRGLVRDSRLIDRGNVIFTPHSAFNSREAVARIDQQTVRNIRHYLSGKPVNVVP